LATPTTASPIAGITARLELPSKTMTAGSTLSATVVVRNTTAAEITAFGCHYWFQVLLGDARYQPPVDWLACGPQPFPIPPGTSRYRTTIAAIYLSCSPSGSGDRVCGRDGRPPPLPTGKYKARLYQSTAVVPGPKPVMVRVTR
jgi:hypothetical protein